MFDVEQIRQDFPILHQDHHPGRPLIYFDNAASSQHPVQVIDAMTDYYRRYHANVHRGLHKLSEEATNAYEGAREAIRAWINAPSREQIIYTRGTTEGINLVAQSWGRANLSASDCVISTQMEHHSNIIPYQLLQAEKGFRLRFLPILADGRLDLSALEDWLKEGDVRLVAMMHASNVLGTVNPVAQVIELAHRYGALVLIDAAQSVPHMKMDVQALDVDFLAFSGHKMLGPTGIGVLYGKRELLEAMPPFMGGGDMIERVTLEGSTWNALPYKFEAGTPSIAEAIGLGAAVDYLQSVGMENVHQHVSALAERAYVGLSDIPQVTLYGPEERGGLVSFTVAGLHAHDVAQMLDAEGIAVRSGHHCAQPLHTALNVSATARASFYFYNTLAEVDQLVTSVQQVVDKFGKRH